MLKINKEQENSITAKVIKNVLVDKTRRICGSSIENFLRLLHKLALSLQAFAA